VTTCNCCQGETKRFGRFKNRNGIVQRYRCSRCGKTFSDEQPLDGIRTDLAKVVQIVQLFTEGVGVRAISRLTGCHTRTVLDVLLEIGTACDRLHDRLVRNIDTDFRPFVG
jgi:transposase-like protein